MVTSKAKRSGGGAASSSEATVTLARPEDTFGFRLWRVLHAWVRRVEAALAPLDLTHMQFVVLAIVFWFEHEGETPSQSRIAGFGQVDRMTLSNVLRLLEDKGYVSRRPHPDDPRANWVALTKAGRAAIIEAKQVVMKAQDDFFGRLPPEGQSALGAQLDALLRLERSGSRGDETAAKPAPVGG